MTTGWQAHLNEAATQRDIVCVCNQFLSMWTAAELAQLPEACRPKELIGLEEVGPYAVKLVLQLGNDDIRSVPQLYRMSTFFTKAALCIAQIRAESREQLVHDDPIHSAFLGRKATG